MGEKLINLLTYLSYLPLLIYVNRYSFIKFNREIHIVVRRNVAPSNEDYKFQDNTCCKFKEYNRGDYVLILFTPSTFLKIPHKIVMTHLLIFLNYEKN